MLLEMHVLSFCVFVRIPRCLSLSPFISYSVRFLFRQSTLLNAAERSDVHCVVLLGQLRTDGCSRRYRTARNVWFYMKVGMRANI
jgi:hypothetical protein